MALRDPLVSVVMPAYEYAYFIAEALRSLEAQTYRHWECVIVDDCSTDHTREVVAPFLEDRRFRYYLNPCHLGYPGAVNRGVDLATGEFIAMLDADDVSLPHRLAISVEALEQDRDCELVFGQSPLIDKESRPLPDVYWKRRGELPMFHELYVEGNYIPNTTVMMRRRHLEAAGYCYDSSFGFCNDYEHNLRVVHDYRAHEIKAPLTLVRRGHPSMCASKELYFQAVHRILYRIWRRYRHREPNRVSTRMFRQALARRLMSEADHYRPTAKRRFITRMVGSVLLDPLAPGNRTRIGRSLRARLLRS